MLMQRLNTGKTGKVFKMILLGVLFAAVAGLVLTDMGGFFRDGVGRQDVARVGRKEISLVSFAQSYRQALQQSNMPEEAARQMGVPFMLLQQEVGREILLQAAHKTGIRISDAYVGTELKKQLDTLKQPGTPQEKLDMLLQQRGMTQKTFVDLVRGDYAINLLSGAPVSSDMKAPPALADASYAADKEKRVAHIVTITPDKLKNKKTLNDAALKAFYDENKERYKTEETRDIAVLVLPKATFMKDNVSVTDADVQTYYNEHTNEFLNPERVRMEQIIVQSKDEAEALLDKKPSSLEKEKGDKAQFVAADWYTKTTLPKELQTALYPKKEKGLVGPVETSLGWHILNVETYEDAKPKEFADVKDTIQRLLKDEKLDAQISQFSEHVDSLISSGQGLNAIADEYKMKTKSATGISATNAQDKIKALDIPKELADRLQESTFALGDEEVSPLIDMPNGDYLLLQVTKINDATVPALETIKARVAEDAQKATQARDLIAYAEKVIGEYDTRKPETFLKAVEKNGLSVETTAALDRAEADKALDKGNAGLLFSLTPGNRLSFTNAPDKVTLVFLKEIVASNEKPSDKELADLNKKMGEVISQELSQQFMQAWQNEIGVAINRELVQRQFIDTQVQ